MDFEDVISQSLNANFELYGKSAMWNVQPEPVLVILPPEQNDEEVLRLGGSRFKAQGRLLHVRATDVIEARRGDHVDLGTECFEVMAEPVRIKGGRVWQCEIRPA